MKEIKNIPTKMKNAAKELNEGKLLVVYNDCGVIRCETEHGEDPYVWRNNQWKAMRL